MDISFAKNIMFYGITINRKFEFINLFLVFENFNFRYFYLMNIDLSEVY